MVRVMDGPYTGPFNIGNPTEFTMLELAQVVKEVVNPNATIVYKENTADDPSRRKPDISKARTAAILHVLRRLVLQRVLGWKPCGVFAVYTILQPFWILLRQSRYTFGFSCGVSR